MRLILAILLMLSALARGAEPELLEPEKAFRFSARLKDARTLEINYQIAPGYYLYRDKFRFTLSPAGVKAGEPQLPAGRKHRDEFFGDVETYRGNLTILLPFEPADAKGVRLAALSQGCADVGVCYVPHEQTAELRLAALGAVRQRALERALRGLPRRRRTGRAGAPRPRPAPRPAPLGDAGGERPRVGLPAHRLRLRRDAGIRPQASARRHRAAGRARRRARQEVTRWTQRR